MTTARGRYLPVTNVPILATRICRDCGCLVADRAQHNKWHEQQEGTERA